MIVFTEENHSYKSINEPVIDWESVTTVVANYKQKFDEVAVSRKVCKNKKSKWFGLTPEFIVSIWKKESDRACNLGNWYHNAREVDLINCQTVGRGGVNLTVFPAVTDSDGRKVAQDQKIGDGIYPEFMVYLRTEGLIGQSDLPEVLNSVVSIIDYKTNKEIKTEGFTNWEGMTTMMKDPVSHLEDCNFNHYALQLSLYLYMILRQNPNLKVGDLIIHHVMFEEEPEPDEYGYPITKLSPTGDPIVRELVIYKMPYLKNEVMQILKHRKHAKV